MKSNKSGSISSCLTSSLNSLRLRFLKHRGQRSRVKPQMGDVPQNKDPVSPTNDGKKKKGKERGNGYGPGVCEVSLQRVRQ